MKEDKETVTEQESRVEDKDPNNVTKECLGEPWRVNN